MTEEYTPSISTTDSALIPSPTLASGSNPSISSSDTILTSSTTRSLNPSISTTGFIHTPSTAASASHSNPPSFSSPLRQSHSLANSTLKRDGAFDFPRAYYFPPFFTRQPVLQTHHAQLQKWSSLILAYCRHHKIWKLSLVDALETDLFKNEKLAKRLSREDAKDVVEFMRSQGRAEWIGKGETETWVWWRNVEEWAGLLYEWIDETAQKNTVLTLYELTESEATLSQEFHGMDGDLLQKALTVLVKRGKAQVFGQEDQQGVKFF